MSPRAAARLLAAAGVSWGALLLARPRLVTGLLAPEFPRDREWVVRVLGARQIVQDGALFARPTSSMTTVAAAIDGVHALSMLPLLGSARYRRAAAISGAVAAFGAVSAGGAVATGLLSRE